MLEFTPIDTIPEHSELSETVACFRFGCSECVHGLTVATERFSSSHSKLREIQAAADTPGKCVTFSSSVESWANDCEPALGDCPYEDDISAAKLMINEG